VDVAGPLRCRCRRHGGGACLLRWVCLGSGMGTKTLDGMGGKRAMLFQTVIRFGVQHSGNSNPCEYVSKAHCDGIFGH
jgi:hypothetical protein